MGTSSIYFLELEPGNYMDGFSGIWRMGKKIDLNRPIHHDQSPLIQGHTYQMQIDMKLSNDSTGYLHVWRDGVEIVNYNGPIGYGDQTYWKEGIYRLIMLLKHMVVDYSTYYK